MRNACYVPEICFEGRFRFTKACWYSVFSNRGICLTFKHISNIFQIYFKYIWNIFQINFKSISNIFQIYSKYILNIFQIYLPHRCRCCSLAAPTPLQDANSPRPRRASSAADFADEVFGETVCVHEIRLFDFLYIKVRRIFFNGSKFLSDPNWAKFQKPILTQKLVKNQVKGSEID